MASRESESGRWHCREMMYSEGHSWHCSGDKFVWLDGTGSDGRDYIRKYGYALQGMRTVTHRFLSRGRTNAIAAMSQDGVIALLSGPVNGYVFFNFISSSLIPVVMPFNGVNSRSVLTMDNCSVHVEVLATTCRYYHTVPPPIQF